MKKTAAALALMVLAASATPAFAATSSGAVKLGWTIAPSFTALIASNYKAAQSSFITGTPTIQTSATAGSGTCGTAGADTITTFSLTYGTITPGTAVTGCNYQNAIGISVNTNDSLGYKIYESLDVTTAPSYYGVCVLNNNPTTTAATATTTASAAATAPGAGTFTGNVQTACASGALLPPAASAVTNAGVGGQVALLTAPPTGAYASSLPTLTEYNVAAGAPATGTNFFTQDVQLNTTSNAPSGAQTGAVILYFVPN